MVDVFILFLVEEILERSIARVEMLQGAFHQGTLTESNTENKHSLANGVSYINIERDLVIVVGRPTRLRL